VNDSAIYVVRDGNLILKEYPIRFAMPNGTDKTTMQPDPDYYILLEAL